MNNIKSYSDFITEMKSDKDIVKDLARHLAFDKDIIKYLNTSRAKREIGWREMLDSKLHGKNKDYINYLTKNMIADYNPQITGYIHINVRMMSIEDVLGIDPDDEKSIDRVEKALDDAGYVKPEPEDDEEEE